MFALSCRSQCADVDGTMAETERAIAVGPGLRSRVGWQTQFATHLESPAVTSRVTLNDLIDRWSASAASTVDS